MEEVSGLSSAGITYTHLKELIEQDFPQQLPDVGLLDPRAQYVFDASSEKKAVQTLYDLGVNMYDTLFYSYSADPNLPAILDTIERYGDEVPHLRILIYADSIYLPWQLLHASQPDGEARDPAQFWGNKYILGVIPIDTERDCGRLPGAMTLSGKDAILYAHYWQPISDPDQDPTANNNNSQIKAGSDVVSRLGEMFGKIVTKTLGGGVRTVHDKSEFKDRLKKDRRDLLILLTFTHGHSGDTVLDIPGKPPVTAPQLAGQRIDFSLSDFISAYEIKTETIDRASVPFFAGRPFVFLNGCETGTQGARGTTDLSLPGFFLIRGGRGVVATEAPVWDIFGYNFGALFLEKLAAGNDVGEAMLATRREFLKESKNPLGLLYSYYGNPAVRFNQTRS